MIYKLMTFLFLIIQLKTLATNLYFISPKVIISDIVKSKILITVDNTLCHSESKGNIFTKNGIDSKVRVTFVLSNLYCMQLWLLVKSCQYFL